MHGYQLILNLEHFHVYYSWTLGADTQFPKGGVQVTGGRYGKLANDLPPPPPPHTHTPFFFYFFFFFNEVWGSSKRDGRITNVMNGNNEIGCY